MKDWNICRYDDIEHIERIYAFKKYSTALAFANAVACLAELNGHHPRMVVEWGKVAIAWGTHQSKQGSGVFEKDRVLAQRCDELFEQLLRPVIIS
ncbi:4a-hydroxytetrahydrobiopterin dehydratase [Endozoicomonas ascidiicola]|uniref:4a-hydroxytetrahydrobiopterin dehydratase n=1 Tax=Endozoicomonas ascidiicola TaxID=1698521 RepID=UPI000830F6C1|nr:4a-hydroxytetrahydrobiopterin dehydratase [Endozoicomonas ascidiicola]